jgi:two-component system, NarL family, sensor histidine kinase DesK
MAIDLAVSQGSPAVQRVVLDVTESEIPDGAVAVRTSGTGLLGMRERVEAHGGELAIEISAAGGLSLHAWLPVEVVHA